VIIDEKRYLDIYRHASVQDRGVPKAVVLAIGTVTGGDEVKAAWPDWITTDPAATTWTCWVVTQKALGFVQVEYEKALYDEYSEREHNLNPKKQTAWVRRLSDIIEVGWGAVYEAQERDKDYCPAEPITIRFADWATAIPTTEGGIPPERRSAADGLLTALREGAGF
jgi:hypothetical protein